MCSSISYVEQGHAGGADGRRAHADEEGPAQAQVDAEDGGLGDAEDGEGATSADQALQLCTNFRHEEVYLYRLAFNASVVRNVFLEYVRIMNELCRWPQWYNALFNNCTTAIRALARPYTRDAALD